MRLSPTVASELHHKMTVVQEEPDLLECYDVTSEDCDMIIEWCKSQHLPDEVAARYLLVMAGEMENAAEVTEDQADSAPVNERHVRNRIRYAARAYRGFVSEMNRRMATGSDADAWNNLVTVTSPVHDLAHVRFVMTDGGRREAGFKGYTGDCACRAVALASGRPYKEVYARIIELAKTERTGKRKKDRSHPRTGVYRPLMHRMLTEWGFEWTPVMQIGSGCTVHLRSDELPATGKLVLSLSKHYAAFIDGVLHDTYDCSRAGTRCVYGYWKLEG